MRSQLASASISVDASCEQYDWRGCAKYTEGHGFDIDILRRPVTGGDYTRIAMRNAAFGNQVDGMEIVSDTIDGVRTGRPLGNTVFV